MIQKHSIIIWNKPDGNDVCFDNISINAFSAMSSFNSFLEERFRPNYRVINGKKNDLKFMWDYETFSTALREGVNKEGKKIHYELGYNISFFSSQNERESFSYGMHIGVKDERFYNTLVVEIPVGFDVFDNGNASIIESLFLRLTKLMHPYWACVSNRSIARQYSAYLNDGIPTAVYWLNYWSSDLVNKIGRRRIQKVINANPQISFIDGILKLQELPITDKDVKRKRIEYELLDITL